MEQTQFDTKRVNAAVKIFIDLLRLEKKKQALVNDLRRLQGGMSDEEYKEFVKRKA